MEPSPKDTTELLIHYSQGHAEALEQLLPLVYEELRRIARRYLQRVPPNHTLQATALVHEAYLRLVNQRPTDWQSRAHFIGIAARCMRQILVGYAKRQQAIKRGGRRYTLSLAQVPELASPRNVDLMVLDGALEQFALLDARKARLVELRFFGGLSVEETAEVLQISPATVKREWAAARAWLHREIRKEPSYDP